MDPKILTFDYVAKGNKRVSLELYQTGDGGFVLEHDSKVDWDRRRTHIISKPDGYSTICFDRFTMMPKYHYRFVVNPETTVRAIAEKIWAQGSFDMDSAIELSDQIEQTVQDCTARKLGKIEHSSGGWAQCYNDFIRNSEGHRR